jgi:uncharacterized membrane protein YdjX (TVP38/TMEM64 family)
MMTFADAAHFSARLGGSTLRLVRHPAVVRLAPLAVLAALLAAFFLLGGGDLVSIETLREHRAAALAFVAAHPIVAVSGYVAAYALLVAIGFPSAIVLTVAGGYLFGMPGAAAALVGATLGAFIMFLAARTAFSPALKARLGRAFARLEAGFQSNAFSYLLSLRLFPFAPFLGVTLAAAVFRVSPWRFVLATALGSIPASLVYTGVGAGAGAALDEGGPVSLTGAFFQPMVLGPLVAAAALAVAPALWRHWRSRPPEAA